MRSYVSKVATFLIVATAAFSQQSAVSASTGEMLQKNEQQIQQLEADILKGEMNSDPVVFEKILADDCLNLPAGPDLTKAKLVEGVRKAQGQAPPYIAREEDMHVYMLGDTAIAIYVKEYAVRANPNQVDRTPDEWIAEWRAWAASHRALAGLADDDRKSIYAERGE